MWRSSIGSDFRNVTRVGMAVSDRTASMSVVSDSGSPGVILNSEVSLMFSCSYTCTNSNCGDGSRNLALIPALNLALAINMKLVGCSLQH